MSTERRASTYWTKLIKSLRAALQLSQAEFSERVGIDQATVSRWERGLNEPQYDMRRILDDMARSAGLATLEDLGHVVNASPFPMILVSQWQEVLAASVSSGFDPRRLVADQTPPEERAFLQDFVEELDSAGFWTGFCQRYDYAFRTEAAVRSAIVTAVTIRGEVFALVQKAW
jgi:transcriptional regulator with XRE-family HTH domain